MAEQLELAIRSGLGGGSGYPGPCCLETPDISRCQSMTKVGDGDGTDVKEPPLAQNSYPLSNMQVCGTGRGR